MDCCLAVGQCEHRSAVNFYWDMTMNADDLIAFENGTLSEHDVITLFQRLIDDGSVWHLQGYYGRSAMAFIDSGLCTLGPIGHLGPYGNYVPSRFEVKPGTKGSSEFLASVNSSYKEILQEASARGGGQRDNDRGIER